MSGIVIFLTGLFIGALFGILIMGVLQLSKDERDEELSD